MCADTVAAVDMKDINKLALLEELWYAACDRSGENQAFDVESAKLQSESRGRTFEMVQGQAISADLSGDSIYPRN